MIPSADFERVNILVVGGVPGARYRAGRTCRHLKRRFKNVEDTTDGCFLDLAKRLIETETPLWLLRAGTLPRELSHWYLPHPAPTPKALCGFGSVSIYHSEKTPRTNKVLNEILRREYSELRRECADWEQLQSETGGDFSSVERFHERAPRIGSVLLDVRMAHELGRRVADKIALDAALRATLDAMSPRCVRLPHLDIVDDPALRIAQASTSLQRGGAERIALDLTRELPTCGVRPLFFALGSPTRAAFEPPEDLIDFTPGRNRAEHIRNFGTRAISLGCDAVHAHLLSASDMAIVEESGLPVIATVHNSKQGWPADFASVGSKLPATMLVACSKAVERDVIAANLNVPVRTIWNGIDAGAFERLTDSALNAHDVRTKLQFGPNDFVLLSLANPRPQKRLERLPAVLDALQNEFRKRGIIREAKLIVAGEASRTNDEAQTCELALRAEIARLNLGKSVRLIGPAENVASLLWASDALVSVSEWEGLSLAHLEALAAGCAVVATDAGGTAEIAPENPAITVIPLNASPEWIASKLADIEERNPHASAGKRSSFTLHCMAERYASFYPRAIERARGNRRCRGVWLIANNFTTGGAQSSARRLLLGLQSKSIPVRAAVLQEREDHPTPGLSALRAAEIFVFIPEPRSVDPLNAVMQILERIDTDPPHAILFWNVIAEHKLLLADALVDIPIFDVSPGEMFFDSLNLYFTKPRPGLPYRCPEDYGTRLDGMVVKYHQEAERSETDLGIKPHVIPNGLPLKSTLSENDGGKKYAGPDGLFAIGTCARLSPQKKLEELIHALRLAAPHLPPHVLKIAGRPEAGGDAYAQELKNLGAGLNIEWVGEVNDAQQFLASLDLFAMISEPAGCPNASLEAMAAGLPVIATDHGGASEQVEDGVTGCLVPRANSQAFADALVALAHEPERRSAFGTAGRTRVETYFSIERMVNDYRKLCGV